MDGPLEILEATGRWRARDVRYWAGRWDRLRHELPQFKTEDFRAEPDAPSNPYMKSVVRLPRTKFERPVPVGVVSNNYTLAQHGEVAEKCFEGILASGVETDGLKCELGLTELGEWMNLCIYFPDSYSHTPRDGKTLGLRLECFNSVDGSSRLVLLLGWLRFVCANGLVIGETKAELKAIHNQNMDLEKIPEIIRAGMEHVTKDLRRLTRWDQTKFETESLEKWANKDVTDCWGKKAACRVFHICRTGIDVEIAEPFASGEATEKPVQQTMEVPGATKPATTLYDASQALSWIATNRNNPEERLEWQSQIPQLVEALRASA